MSIQRKFLVIALAVGLAILATSFFLIKNSQTNLIQAQAETIADIVSTQVLNDRAVYTKELVGKLKKEGVGAAIDSKDKPGFIPLPAQFVRIVSERVAGTAGDLYRYFLKSKWNLNPENGLQDEFDNWAWNQLEEQEKNFSKSNPGESGYPWQSVFRFESNRNGKSYLRYMRADPTSAAACKNCHNAWEKKPDIAQLRQKQGFKDTKQWEMHQLMGALRVDIPLTKIAQQAAADQGVLMGSIAATLILCFAIMVFLISRFLVAPMNHAVSATTEQSSMVGGILAHYRELMDSCERQIQIIDESGEGSQTTKDLRAELLESTRRIETAAAECLTLNKSMDEMNNQLVSIRGQGKKS